MGRSACPALESRPASCRGSNRGRTATSQRGLRLDSEWFNRYPPRIEPKTGGSRLDNGEEDAAIRYPAQNAADRVAHPRHGLSGDMPGAVDSKCIADGKCGVGAGAVPEVEVGEGVYGGGGSVLNRYARGI